MKRCKRLPVECFNKCGKKDIPREEVYACVHIWTQETYRYNYTICTICAKQLPRQILNFIKVDTNMYISSSESRVFKRLTGFVLYRCQFISVLVQWLPTHVRMLTLVVTTRY